MNRPWLPLLPSLHETAPRTVRLLQAADSYPRDLCPARRHL